MTQASLCAAAMIHLASMLCTMSWFLRCIVTTALMSFGEMLMKICKRESAKKEEKKKGCSNWVCTYFYDGLTNVMFCHHSHQSACSKESRWTTNTCSAMDYHSHVCVWKKTPLKLMSMFAKWPLCFFYISHCVSGVRWLSWILYPVD